MLLRRLIVIACIGCTAAAAAAAASAHAGRPALSAGEYRRQANAICDRINRFQLPRTGSLADQLSAGLDVGRSALAALRRLHPPAPLAQLHAAILANDVQELHLLTSLVTALKARRITLAQFASRFGGNPYAARNNALWTEAGALECVRG